MEINSNNFNDKLVKEVDSKLLPLVKDLDGNIKYTSVLSQEDFNIIKPDNDTIYFINNITDEPLSLTNILDVAVSWTDKTNSKPEFIWMLIGDTELQYVYLYKMPLESGPFELVKEYEGYVDGRLTFDGVFDYNEDHSKTMIITNNEPFVILLNDNDELFAFPNLKYKTKGSDRYKAIKIDDNVLAFSVDKGYCSDLFRKDDQGIVVAYSVYDNGHYSLCYKQYGYPNEEHPTLKVWGSRVVVCQKSEPIFGVNVRRLNDYRLGLTYNYWEKDNNNIEISKTEFRYSKNIYAGVAYHPEVIEINEIPTIKGILYGAVTNEGPRVENAGKIPLPILQIASISEGRKTGEVFDSSVGQLIGRYEFDMIYQLSSYSEEISGIDNINKKVSEAEIQLEVIDTEDIDKIIYQKDSDISLENILKWRIETDWPYSNYDLEYDPELGTCTAVPDIKKVSIEKNKIILTLKGEKPPAVPFRVVPSSEWNNQIHVRYRADSFNEKKDDEETDLTLSRNLSGWFALNDFSSSLYGQTKAVGMGAEPHTFKDYDKKIYYNSNLIMKTARTISNNKTFTINGFNYNSFCEVDLINVTTISNNIKATINFSVSCSGNAFCKGVRNIDV